MATEMPLGLSMLWESVEPEAALKQRFGFDSFRAATHWVSAVLEQTWGLTALEFSRMAISDQNAIVWVASDRGGLVVKWSRATDRFPKLEASTRLLSALAAQGAPVPSPITSLNGLDRETLLVRETLLDRETLEGPSCAVSFTVLPELAGDWLDVQDHAAVRSAGACLAEIHRTLGATHVDGSVFSSRSTGLKEHIGGWLENFDRGFAPEATRRLVDLLARASDLDDQTQLVHNDFRAANILTRNSRITGVLDFDDVVIDHRVSDLAKACVYLGTLFTDWRPTPLAVRQSLRAGYESVRPLSRSETEWFEILELWHGLMAIPGENDTAGWASGL
ncbi:phosphotransferase enzyme family protein [Rhodococcus erythropolis]|uniref:phosphotransferase enzyme family protein n=1 Tax=Rhodococcus erythropolis TaxID=1833 RepID=UPI001F2F392C|nr:phosphotransferase [Rhodococcus erythropolis]